MWCYLSETLYLTRLRRPDLRLSDITTWLSALFAQFGLRRHSPMVFVYRRIYVRAPIRLRRSISAAWSTHPCSLNSLSDVHGVAECVHLPQLYKRLAICAFAQLDQCLHRAHGELSWVNDLRVKTTLDVCRLCLIWPTEARVFHTCHRNIHVSKCQKGHD